MKRKNKKNHPVQMDINEFMALREEMNFRLSVIYTEEEELVKVVVAFWAASFFVYVFSASRTIAAEDVSFTYVLMLFIQALIVGIPPFFILPTAVKSGENLRQIETISCYFRVFYEYPSVKYRSLYEKNKRDIIHWEMSHNVIFPALEGGKNTRWIEKINLVYMILAIISFVIYGVNAFYSLFRIYLFNATNAADQKSFIWILILFICYGIFQCVVLWLITEGSSVKKNMRDIRGELLQTFVRQAVTLHVIVLNDSECQNISASVDAFSERLSRDILYWNGKDVI